LHRVHLRKHCVNVLNALRDFGRRIIRQPIVPGVQTGLAASDREFLVSPGIEFIRQLVQGGGFGRTGRS
jgi:hypothetical protein